MSSGPPLQLPPDLPLHSLFPFAAPPGLLGAWVRESRCAVHLYEADAGVTGRVLVSHDLGYLLGRCSRIALREGENLVVLPADSVIQWRALEVVTTSPYLRGIERLRALFPGLLPAGS